jgi:RNA polymerase sigma factor (TIGR02999 family)
MASSSDSPGKNEAANLTALLNRMCEGDRGAGDQAVSLLYQELHNIASREMRREQVGHTLQTTALINEAYLKLAGPGSLQVRSRAHFFAIASQQMRRILVDHARASGAQKRGAGAIHIDADAIQTCAEDRGASLLALDDALKDLENLDPQAARVVELRYFGGYTDQEVADSLGVSVSTVRRDWEFARSWLYDQIKR